MSTQMVTLGRAYAPKLTAPASAPTCGDCGETEYAGACLNVGACERADVLATRRARGERVKSRQAPAAWRSSGATD